MWEKIKEIVDKEFYYEGELKPETRIIEDLGADSLDLPVLVINLEEKFGIRIHDEEIETITTIGDIVTILEKKMTVKEKL
jgi:acyl carrier protein